MLHPAAFTSTFLSTPSARRATVCSNDGYVAADISIHALREEGDEQQSHHQACANAFLSTPSARRATFGAVP